MEKDGAAAVQDPFWSTFHHQQVSGLRRVGVLVNGQLEGIVHMSMGVASHGEETKLPYYQVFAAEKHQEPLCLSCDTPPSL